MTFADGGRSSAQGCLILVQSSAGLYAAGREWGWKWMTVDGSGAGPPPDRDPAPAGGQYSAAADWIAIWQSELSAMATDREVQEAWVRAVSGWAQVAQAVARFMVPPAAVAPGSRDEPADGRTGTHAAARAEAVMAAPDARDAAVRRLAERVEELERQLRGLVRERRERERGGGEAGDVAAEPRA